jgi:uncharacterized protein YodC (DUF2158 family)
MSFKVGDVVKLKSGGPLMTITGTSIGPGRPTLFTCNWFDKDNREQAASYPAEALELGRTSKPTQIPSSSPPRRGGSSEGGTGWMGR